MMKRIYSIMMLMALLPGIAIAQERTPEPEIYVEEGYDVWVITAIGEGEVHLYKDLSEVENPYTIEVTEEEQYYVFGAYAKAEGCFPSNFVEYEVYIPPMEGPIIPPMPPSVNTRITDRSVIVEVNCHDEFKPRLFIDDVEVGIPFALPRSREDYEVGVYVVAELNGYEYMDALTDVFVPAAENFVPDVNDDGEVDIADMTALIDYVLGPRRWWIVDIERADFDGDGRVTIADVMALIDYLIYGNWQV